MRRAKRQSSIQHPAKCKSGLIPECWPISWTRQSFILNFDTMNWYTSFRCQNFCLFCILKNSSASKKDSLIFNSVSKLLMNSSFKSRMLKVMVEQSCCRFTVLKGVWVFVKTQRQLWQPSISNTCEELHICLSAHLPHWTVFWQTSHLTNQNNKKKLSNRMLRDKPWIWTSWSYTLVKCSH